jgi:RNA polymerase sigma factor (sigma-70 family)
MNICMRYARCEEEAMEIVNDGFFKIMTNLDKYKEDFSFKAWLRRVMVNASIDHYRRNEKHYHNLDISFLKGEESLTPEVWSNFSEEIILQAIQNLPASYRIVFNLHIVEGYRHEEIAHMLGITAGTSRSNLNIARTKLMRSLRLEFNEKAKQNGSF